MASGDCESREKERKAEMDLLLVGKTGSGKSALGNSILMLPAFISSSSMNSATQRAQYDVSEFEGIIIKVVDTPGVGDTGDLDDPRKGLKLVTDAMKDAISLSVEGFHAILIVKKFGERFTKEDVDTVTILKKIFGEDFIRYHSILLLTNGDQFKRSNKNSSITFERWCEGEGGHFATLYKECSKRVVLFDNTVEDETAMMEQIRKLIDKTRKLSASGVRYTSEIFQKAQESRDAMLKDPSCIYVNENILREVRLITQQLHQIDLTQPVQERMRLQNLQIRVDALRDEIKLLHGKTKVYKMAKRLYDSVKEQADAQLQALENLLRKETEKQQELEEMAKELSLKENELQASETKRKRIEEKSARRHEELKQKQEESKQKQEESKQEQEELLKKLEVTEKLYKEAKDEQTQTYMNWIGAGMWSLWEGTKSLFF